jgi:hypothetical protein
VLSDHFPKLTQIPYAPAINDGLVLLVSALATVLVAEFVFARPRVTTEWVKNDDKAAYASSVAHHSFREGDPPMIWEIQVNYVSRSGLSRLLSLFLTWLGVSLVLEFEPTGSLKCGVERQQTESSVIVRRSNVTFQLRLGEASGTLTWARVSLEPHQTPGSMTVKCKYRLQSRRKGLAWIRPLVYVGSNIRELRLVRTN